MQEFKDCLEKLLVETDRQINENLPALKKEAPIEGIRTLGDLLTLERATADLLRLIERIERKSS